MGLVIDWSTYEIESIWDKGPQSEDPVFLNCMSEFSCSSRFWRAVDKVHNGYFDIFQSLMMIGIEMCADIPVLDIPINFVEVILKNDPSIVFLSVQRIVYHISGM